MPKKQNTPSSKKLWLVRHGESKAQTGEQYSFDADLSALGERQSKKLSPFFSKLKFDRIYISPLRRARQTFEIGVPGKCRKVFFDSRLVEILPSESYSQMLPYEIVPDYARSDVHNAWLKDPAERIEDFLNEIYGIPGQNVLAVAHSAILSVLLNVFISSRFGRIANWLDCPYCKMDNAALSLLEIGAERKDDKMHFWNREAGDIPDFV